MFWARFSLNYMALCPFSCLVSGFLAYYPSEGLTDWSILQSCQFRFGPRYGFGVLRSGVPVKFRFSFRKKAHWKIYIYIELKNTLLSDIF